VSSSLAVLLEVKISKFRADRDLGLCTISVLEPQRSGEKKTKNPRKKRVSTGRIGAK